MIDQIRIKSDNNIRHFTWTPMYISIVDNSTKYFVARQQGKGTHSCASITTFTGLVLLKASCTSTVMQREWIVCLHCCYCYSNPPRRYVIKHPIWIFTKIRPVGAVLLRADGRQTDMKIIGTLRYCRNSPIKRVFRKLRTKYIGVCWIITNIWCVLWNVLLKEIYKVREYEEKDVSNF
jgi:hypothetical protein